MKELIYFFYYKILWVGFQVIMMKIITTNFHMRAQCVSQILKIIDTKFVRQQRNTHISKMESNSRRQRKQLIEY